MAIALIHVRWDVVFDLSGDTPRCVWNPRMPSEDRRLTPMHQR